jgi:alpha-beta hydrolase superfamily lysophospholipase
MAKTAIRTRSVLIPPRGLAADLRLPPSPAALVVFAHGSGSSRLSPRNAAVAEGLAREGMASLLLDLLTEAEGRDRGNVFDIELLAGRLAEAVAWAEAQPELRGLPIALFGASTGAAAAMLAAGRLGDRVGAVISRGGRPDLAGERLHDVRCPTLLIVGGADDAVLELNLEALEHIIAPKAIRVIPGATHLFSEPGALEEVTRLAADWCRKHLGAPEPAADPWTGWSVQP